MIFYAVHFNRPDFVEIQQQSIERFKGNRLVVVDNGTDGAIQQKCKELGVECYTTPSSAVYGDPSISHAHGLNYLKTLIDYTDDWCILDHDVFICKIPDLEKYSLIAIKQVREGYPAYLFPGFLAGSRVVTLDDVDFLPQIGRDTGALTSILIEKGYNIRYITEEYLGDRTTDYLQTSPVLVKFEELAIHYLNGSNWMVADLSIITEKNRYLVDYLNTTD